MHRLYYGRDAARASHPPMKSSWVLFRSLLSQDEGPFLAHVYPTPARYVTNAKKFAAALHRAVTALVANELPPAAKLRIIPDFVHGGSIGPAPK